MSDDPYTLEVRLCDNRGMVSDDRVEPGSPGTAFDPDLTYRKLLNNLKARNGNPDTRAPYEGEPFACTGSAHLGGEHIRCTGPAHARPSRDLEWAKTMLADPTRASVEMSGMSGEDLADLRREFGGPDA